MTDKTMQTTPCRHGVRVVQRGDGDERGVVIVFLALALTMLLIFAAFMVDLGAWYKQGQDLQRTADAAALAASTYVGGNAAPQPSNVDLPANCGASAAIVLSTAPQSVYCSALKVVLKNGYNQAYTDPTFLTTTVDQPDHKVQVTLNQTNVGSYFSSFFHGPLTLDRSSNAVFSAPIPLGSPQNYFGTGNLPGFPGVSVGPDSQTTPPNGPDFWAAIAGACAPAEMGDPVASYYDGNVATGTTGGVPDYEANVFTGAGGGTCGSAAARVTNSQFNGAGYLYDISVPAGGASLYIYNPYFDPCETDAFGNSYTLDIDWNFGAYGTCGSTRTKMTMYYALQAPGSGSWTIQSFTPKTAANQIKTFTKLSDLTPGTWLLNISSLAMTASGGTLQPQTSPDTQSFGTHVYSLLATKNTGGAATLPIDTLGVDDATYACTTLTDPQCPEIYADPNGGGAEAEIISSSNAKSATAYLASIPPSAIGHDVQIKLWGPGVLGQFMEILDATGTPLPSFSLTASGNNTATIPASGSPPVITTCQDPTNGNANFTDPDTGNPVATGVACVPVDQCVDGPTDTALTEVACANPVSTTAAIASGSQITTLPLNIPGTLYSGDQIYFPCSGYFDTFDVAGSAGQTWTGSQSVPIYSATPSCAFPSGTTGRADRVGAPGNRIDPAIYGDGTVTLTFTVTPAMLGCATQAGCTTATNNGWFSIRETVQNPPVNNVLNFNVAVLGLPPHLTP